MEIDDIFKVHRLNIVGIDSAEELAAGFTTLLRLCERLAGPTSARELAIVRTKLQEASFFAKRAMAQDPAVQEKADV